MNPSSSPDSKCPQCGEPLPHDAVVGLCPRCLMIGAMQPTQAGDQSAPMPILTPEEVAPHFPQLEIIECLGRGGMGVVYKARQKSLNRLVALKLLAPERADDPHFAERFEKEAHALAALNHPHIVGVHDFGSVAATPPSLPGAGDASSPFYYLVMEFVDGVNLRQAMKAGRFTPEQALAVVPPVCEALQYAHEHGIVHRDIKPENLLLNKEGRVKIADFGIAKMLGESGAGILPVDSALTGGTPALPSMTAGTPQYMSPEQKAHGVTDHRADIYSLGVVLYEMLTGELPADSLQPPSRKVQIDVRLDEIVLRALEKTPELRYQTAGEFRTQVETIALGRAGVAPGSPKTNTDERALGGTPNAATGTVALPGPRLSRAAAFWSCCCHKPIKVLKAIGLGILAACAAHLLSFGAAEGIGNELLHLPWKATMFIYPAVAGIFSVIAIVATLIALCRLPKLAVMASGFAAFSLFCVTLPSLGVLLATETPHMAVVISNFCFLPMMFLAWMLKSDINAISPSSSRREEAQTENGNPSKSLLASAPARQTARVSDYASWGVFLLAYAGLLFLLATTASQLPPRVASHFGLEGRPNDWMSRASYLALFGCLPLLFGGVAVLISWMTRRLPARFINIPRRDFWLTPERLPAVAAFLRRRMFWLAVLMTAFFAGLHLLTVHANQSVPVHLPLEGLLVLVMAFLLALLVWTICLLMRLAEVDKPLTSSTSSRGRESAPTKPEKSASLVTSAATSGEPRFSRTAIIGASWVPLFLLAFVLYVILHTVHEVHPGEPVPSGPGPGVWLMMAVMFVGFAAPLGTTILGWVAFGQIRHSAGRLRGKGLALFDGLFFPVLAVLAVPIYFWFVSKPTTPSPSQAVISTEQWEARSQSRIRSLRTGQCVVVSHGKDVQFVLYCPEDFGHSVSGGTGTEVGAWHERVDVTLRRSSRTFTVSRSSDTPDYITIHGLKFSMEDGRAFVLGGDGRIEQVKFFPTPLEGINGDDLVARIEKIRKEGGAAATATLSEDAFKAPEPRQEASNAQFRVTVHVFEAPADFEERDLRPGDLEDGNAVQMTNSTDVVVRSGGEGRIKVPELPLTSEGVSGGSGYKTRTLYVKPTLIAAGTRVRLVLERDVPETGARDFIYANSLQLGAPTIIQSKSVVGRKQMAVLSVEMEGIKQEVARPGTESAVVQHFGISSSHFISQIISLLVLLGFLYLVYRVWRRYGVWAALLLLIATLAVVLMLTIDRRVLPISSSSPRLVVTLANNLVQGAKAEPVSKPAEEIQEQTPLKVTKEQVAQIETLLKKGPVTTDYLAAIFEHDETSGSSYRRRADVVAIPIHLAEKSASDTLPLGEVLHLTGDTTFYVQWDEVIASTLHYYGPYDGSSEIAKALELKLTSGKSEP